MPDIDARLAQHIARTLATEISAQPSQVGAAVALLDEGATVPFIARYRKEATGGLDDTQLRTLETRLSYLRELEERRAAVIASIQEQGKLTDELRKDIEGAESKARLEDLYLPYKPKRRTRAQIAREAGLEPLADSLLSDPSQAPETAAAAYVSEEKGVADVKAALEGARAILMERWGENAALLGELRSWLDEVGIIHAKVAEGKETEGVKYRDYFDHSELLAKIPSHRLLALFRAQREQILSLELEAGPDAEAGHLQAEGRVARHAGVADRNRAADRWLLDACRLTWRAKLHVHLQLDLFGQARERGEAGAIKVFGENLKDLLLAAPAGPRSVLGLDPGLRTGVKVAVVDRTGKVLATETIYPHAPKNQWDASLATLGVLCVKHAVELIAIGNGTASRETDKLATEVVKKLPQLKMQKVVVSEAGASVYSASELAAKEFPALDVSLRGAVSIARRLQDPLAELVKIEPKAIGVGQYQHDVNPVRLAKALDSQVEDCVNAVGVHVNTASAALLARVSGLSSTVAENIIRYRDEKGAFTSRKLLLEVPRLGPKVFEQCAGFLRIDDGEEPLDSSSVHPEAYPVVQRIVKACGREIKQLIGDGAFLRTLQPESFTDETFGVPTVRDILKELEKPGRDPRPEFRAAQFAEGIEDLKDLKPGMILEGVVTNVAAFGAFVDIGVHQDGLVHISALADTFVKDPRDVVKAGDIVKVRVLEVDLQRKRIALTRRLEDKPVARSEGRGDSAREGGGGRDAPRGGRGDGARGGHAGSGTSGRDGHRGARGTGASGAEAGASGADGSRGDTHTGGERNDGASGGQSANNTPRPIFRGNDATRAAALRNSGTPRGDSRGGGRGSRGGPGGGRGDGSRGGPGGGGRGAPGSSAPGRGDSSRGGFRDGRASGGGAPRDRDASSASRDGGRHRDSSRGAGNSQSKDDASLGNSAMAEAFARAKRSD